MERKFDSENASRSNIFHCSTEGVGQGMAYLLLKRGCSLGLMTLTLCMQIFMKKFIGLD